MPNKEFGESGMTRKVRLWTLPDVMLIVPGPSGVIYTNQVMGYACAQPEVEGFLVPLVPDYPIDFKWTTSSRYTRRATWCCPRERDVDDRIASSAGGFDSRRLCRIARNSCRPSQLEEFGGSIGSRERYAGRVLTIGFVGTVQRDPDVEQQRLTLHVGHISLSACAMQVSQVSLG